MGNRIKRPFLSFRQIPPKPGNKLNRYKVYNDYFGIQIGIIHWKGGWRQYVFQALPKTDMNMSCNREVNKFIELLMYNWRQSLKGKRFKVKYLKDKK